MIQGDPGQALKTVILTIVFVIVLVIAVRPLMTKLSERASQNGWTAETIGFMLMGIFTCALATELIGIHALFGAFALGVIMPGDEPAAHDLSRRLETFCESIMLPIFFAYTGLRTTIGLLDSGDDWLWTAVIIAVAIIGKAGGAAISARLAGLSARNAMAIGALMNCRGLMELVALNVGLDLGILSPRLFAMFVIMAIVTTAITPPWFNWLKDPRDWRPTAEPIQA
jgi:Kef-type K+ transport system membrane component KefB